MIYLIWCEDQKHHRLQAVTLPCLAPRRLDGLTLWIDKIPMIARLASPIYMVQVCGPSSIALDRLFTCLVRVSSFRVYSV